MLLLLFLIRLLLAYLPDSARIIAAKDSLRLPLMVLVLILLLIAASLDSVKGCILLKVLVCALVDVGWPVWGEILNVYAGLVSVPSV